MRFRRFELRLRSRLKAGAFLLVLQVVLDRSVMAQEAPPTPASAKPTEAAPPPSGDALQADQSTITVVGHRKPVTRGVEGTSYDVSGNLAAHTGTASDVLNTLPSVNVSPDGAVTLRGSSNVQVYINGKPSAATSGESRALTLQSMAGSDIARVEVITNPSAKFSADGSGIINIIIKKGRKPGENASVSGNVGNDGRANGSASASINRQRFGFSITIGARSDLRPRDEATSTVRVGDPANAGDREQRLNVNARRHSDSLLVGTHYDPSSADSFAFEWSRKSSEARNTYNEYDQNYDYLGSLTQNFVRQSSGPRRQDDDSETLTYSHQADGGGALDVKLLNSLSHSYRDKSYLDVFSVPAGLSDKVRSLTENRHRIQEASVDNVLRVGQDGQLSLGADYQRIHDHFDNSTADLNPITNQEVVDPLLTNTLEVERQIVAAYATFQRQRGKLTVLAGARFEAARTSIGAPGFASITHSDSDVNPSLHVTFDVSDKRQIFANISQSSQRPDAVDLNPFITYVDSQNVLSGNSDLRPQRVTIAELGYVFPIGNIDLSLTGYYRESRNTITDYSYFVGDGVLLTTKRNSGLGRSAGATYDLSGPLLRGLTYDLSGTLFYATLRAQDVYGDLNNSGVSFNAKATLYYHATPHDQLQVDINRNGAVITAQGSSSATTIFNLALSHDLSKRLTLTARFNDLGNGSTVVTRTRTATISRVDTLFTRGREGFVGLSYKFGNH